VLSFLTLGSPGDAQLKDGMEHDGEESRFMHHYKMPPFSNNEAMMIRGTNRRETGHGRLAEKAIEAVLPPAETFPYTIRLVSEVLGSGGSTSMASVCGSTLALMAG
jgi:polyribonucleotide nucleotidyltransferase